MSDSQFTPAKVGDATPLPPSDAATPPNPLLEIAGMGEEIAQALSHIATMIPSLGPLMALANRVKARTAALRAAIEPPVDGPQHDHS